MKILDIEPIKDDGVTSCYDAQLQSLGKWFQTGYECMYLDSWKFVFGPEGMKGQGIWERGNLALRLYFDIVNIGLHFFYKDIRPYAALCSEA